MKVIEQFFHVVLFIMLYKVLTFKSVDETLVYDHLNESYQAMVCGILCLTFCLVITSY